MKSVFISDLLVDENKIGTEVTMHGWCKSKRDYGGIVFVNITDSTGNMQVIFNRDNFSPNDYERIKKISKETAIKVVGLLQQGKESFDIVASSYQIIGESTISLSPSPRDNIDIFNPDLQEYLMSNKHFYIRNEKNIAILKFRSLLMAKVRDWFEENRFIEITAPILTPTLLYEDGSALFLDIHGQKVFLTQCVGFYLESAVHAFERIYNIGPSFRGEEGRSKRHLMEYWHIKAELAFCDFEGIVSTVESLISYVNAFCLEKNIQEIISPLDIKICTDGLDPPFPRIDYAEAINYLQKKGCDIEFGKSLGSDEEAILSFLYDKPFWVVGIPRTIEPFPYSINPLDTRRTMTADLIASNGYGELLGVAEKIYLPEMLDERMIEKNKFSDERYDWLKDLRQYGCVPHAGFGMGIERLIRWLLDIPHVRDTIPFFRTFGRKIEP
ncbi:MAG: OB-fold nucleic acid binding domain-containing protein [Candidatus Shapirobacteria bacterium]|nr:OB-fold nucleic acid binding domain-containing protein [Candidatus Shapirobacteria bacterium]